MMSQVTSKRTVFVGGPIQYAFDRDGSFNAYLKSQILAALAAFETAGFETFSAHRTESFGEMDTASLQKEVCKRDYLWMQACDCFVAVLPAGPDGTPVRTEGTAVELGWASAFGKKIVILQTPGCAYSHLVAGLPAVADATYLDINAVSQNPNTLIQTVSSLLDGEVRSVA